MDGPATGGGDGGRAADLLGEAADQKRKHAAIYDKLIGILDNFLRDEESERELGHQSSTSS